MSDLAIRLRTYWAIGPINGLRALSYRLGLKLGMHPVQRIAAPIREGDFFSAPIAPINGLTPPPHWRDSALLFGTYAPPIDWGPPAWTCDPLADDGGSDPDPETLSAWWHIGDFDGGDIKRIWEMSRLDWAMAFAQQARAGDVAAIARLNAWLSSWAVKNPPYRGPNWKCAQEASIRVLHLSLAALLLGRENEMRGPLQSMVEAHCRRILPTLSYARAQDNNHATSEAAALFVAGAWSTIAGKPGADLLLRRGRRLLEQSVTRLFTPDGSFSQYSVNYHRLALDTLSIAEIWRRRAGLPPFRPLVLQRTKAAADWLRIMVDPASGDAPNLGANDGANLLPLTDARYRDHRPSVQLATVLFAKARAYPAGPWDDILAWLAVPAPSRLVPRPETAVFDDGGYAVLQQSSATAVLRYPRFRFRPGQADILHVDLSIDGLNMLRDGGSYSYNTDSAWIDYFGGVEAHNTVQFDGQPQMPRLSRFLLGDWLQTEDSGPVDGGYRASYCHRAGWWHRRTVRLGSHLEVTDDVTGFQREARLRWRLHPGDWRVEGNTVTDGRYRMIISADVPITTLGMTVGWESRAYLEKTPLPVLEVVIARPGRVISEFYWTS